MGCAKPFHQGHMDLENSLILYYETPHTARVRKLILVVVPFKFRQVVMSAFHIYMIVGHIHEKRTLFRIIEWFLWKMVNMDLERFIRACAYLQSVNS